MNIEETTVTKLIITDVPQLDPVAVYLEDCGPQRGMVTITCFDDAWSYFWGAMGAGRDMRKFFTSCDVDYLANKFRGSAPRHEPDPDKLEAKAKRRTIERRREGCIGKDEARERYDLAEDLCDLWHEMNGHSEAFMDAMYKVFGNYWHEDMPKKPHHQHEYLCRIVKTVQMALKSQSVQEAA
jgi:hypothetical protein